MTGEYGDTIRSTSLYTADNVGDLHKYAHTVWCGTTSGAGNAYTATSTVSFTANIAGTRVRALANFTNAAGSVTFNPNSIAATRVYLSDGSTNPPAGAIVSGYPFELEHNGTAWVLINGYNGPIAWTPTLGTQAGSLSSTSIQIARYTYLRGTTFAVEIRVSQTLGSANSNYFTFTLPYASRSLSYAQYVFLHCEESSAGSPGSGVITDNSTTVQVYRPAAAQWTTGASRIYVGNFTYEAA